MKTLRLKAIVLGLFALLVGTTTYVKAQNDYYQGNNGNGNQVSLQTFYDELSPYGTWIQDSKYGYVWRPNVDQNEFRPYYTNGRWAMTEYGNTWVSNYDWGWAPFHYGRWVFNNYREWIWLPDTNWGPAWVDWRSGGGYYGWAPMAPTIHINLSFGRRYVVPDYCWNFIPQRNIYYDSYRYNRYDYRRNNVYINNTTIINNTYIYNRRSYQGGPRIEDVRRATNRDVRVYRVDQVNRPGASRIDNSSVSIYRPRPDRNTVSNRTAAPSQYEGRADNNDRNSRNGSVVDNRFGTNNDSAVKPSDSRPSRTTDNRVDRNQQDVRTGSLERSGKSRVDQSTNDQRASGDQLRPQRDAQVQQQRTQQEQQQRVQRDAQVQQQRSQQEQQQRIQRDAQVQQQRTQQEQQQRVQRDAQVQQQRSQQEQQQRVQRDAQVQQQRTQQEQQQRVQRDAQVQQQRSQQEQQQRVQRDAQVQQQRSQQDQQQRAQRDAQIQQQRAQQEQQQRVQRDAQIQQQRAQQEQQQRQQQNNNNGTEGGRPSRSGRG